MLFIHSFLFSLHPFYINMVNYIPYFNHFGFGLVIDSLGRLW
jgi:hypothetical protein